MATPPTCTLSGDLGDALGGSPQAAGTLYLTPSSGVMGYPVQGYTLSDATIQIPVSATGVLTPTAIARTDQSTVSFTYRCLVKVAGLPESTFYIVADADARDISQVIVARMDGNQVTVAKGLKGDPGTFASATATTLASDQPATVSLSGPETAKVVNFGIPRGIPGVNGVENDTAVASYLNTAGTQVRGALQDRLGVTLPASAAIADIQSAANSAATLGYRLTASGTITTASTLTLACDADLSQLTINYTGSGAAVLIGDPAAASFRKTVLAPKVVASAKTTSGWAQVAGTVGIDVVNAYSYIITVPQVTSFETGLRVRGANSNGTQQTTFHLGHLDNNKRNIVFTGDATGWANQDAFYGGRCSHNSNEGVQVAGTRHVLFENIPNPVNGHQFFGTSLESPNVVEYHIEAAQTTWCTFWGSRFENTGGDASRRILSSGASKNNSLRGGAYNENMTQTTVSPALPFDVDTSAKTTKRGGTSTSPTMLLENVASSTAPILTFMAAGAGAAGTDPATGYTTQVTANKWMGKRATDAFNRTELDMINGRLYVGDASAAPVGFIGGSASAMFVGGSVPFCPLTTAAQDLGLSSLKWRNLWLSGNATIGGNVGFYGTAAVAKPTVSGSRGGNAALASLITALASQGLITDSTTA